MMANSGRRAATFVRIGDEALRGVAGQLHVAAPT